MMNRIIFIFISIVSALSLFQCSPAGGNATGTEYMPDMVHSVAYEPNVNSYYYYHTWGTSAEIAKLSAPRFPVKVRLLVEEYQFQILHTQQCIQAV